MSEFDLKNQKGVLFELVVDLARKALLEDEKKPAKAAPISEPPKKTQSQQKAAAFVVPKGSPQPPAKKLKHAADGRLLPNQLDPEIIAYLRGRGPVTAAEVADALGRPRNHVYLMLRRLALKKKIRKNVGADKKVTWESRFSNGVEHHSPAAET